MLECKVAGSVRTQGIGLYIQVPLANIVLRRWRSSGEPTTDQGIL
jgi:hypothetical protein